MPKDKSEELLEKILLKIESLDKIDFPPNVRDANKIRGEHTKNIKDLISKLFDSSRLDGFYYLDCPFDVFKKTYKSRLVAYYNEIKEENESLFLKQELEDLMDPFRADYKIDYTKFRNYCQNKIYNASFHSKIEFIQKKLLELGWRVTINPEVNSIPKYSEYCHQNISIIYKYDPLLMKEISDNSKKDIIQTESKPKQLTANQIVLILEEIGFFTLPKIKDASKVKQASLISIIAGLHEKNIKNHIEKLEKPLSENGVNYQKDIDKINKILDDLT